MRISTGYHLLKPNLLLGCTFTRKIFRCHDYSNRARKQKQARASNIRQVLTLTKLRPPPLPPSLLPFLPNIFSPYLSTLLRCANVGYFEIDQTPVFKRIWGGCLRYICVTYSCALTNSHINWNNLCDKITFNIFSNFEIIFPRYLSMLFYVRFKNSEIIASIFNRSIQSLNTLAIL